MVESKEFKNVKLTYFPYNSRAMVARMLLMYGNIEFENKMIKVQDWSGISKNYELQFLPVLEIDGKTYSQSQAIFFYLARKIGNLLGKSLEEQYEILYVLNSDPDLTPIIKNFVSPDPQLLKNPDELKKVQNESLETLLVFCKSFNDRYEKNGKGKYYFGDTISLADFTFLNFGSILNNVIPQIKDILSKAYPTIFNYIDSLYNDDFFKKFLDSDLYIKGSY